MEFCLLIFDETTHVDYFRSMFAAAGGIDLQKDFSQLQDTWISETTKIIDSNILKFETGERWNELAKWVWFKNIYQQTKEWIIGQRPNL